MEPSQEDLATNSSNRRSPWRLTAAEKKLFGQIEVPIVGAVAILSGVAQFLTQNGLLALVISCLIVAAGALAMLVVVLLLKRGRRWVTLPWWVIVLGAVVLLVAGALGPLVASALGGGLVHFTGLQHDETTQSTSSPLTSASAPISLSVPSLPNVPTASDSASASTRNSGPSIIHKVYSDVYLPPPVPGVNVVKGQTVHVEQTDSAQKWNCAEKDYETPDSGIEGVRHKGDAEIFQAPGQNICVLIGKVGNERDWRPIGPKFNFVAEDSGPLWLMANEIPPAQCPYPSGPPNPACYSDNRGFIEVTVSVS